MKYVDEIIFLDNGQILTLLMPRHGECQCNCDNPYTSNFVKSPECLELLQQADIVVTNPPFSIARKYFIPLLIEHKRRTNCKERWI